MKKGGARTPSAASREFMIHGTDGTSRKTRAERSSQDKINKELRTRLCVGCGRGRQPRSGPFCPNCTEINTGRQ